MLTEQEILEILKLAKRPLKAKEMTALLSKRKSQKLERKEINRHLHAMKRRGKLIQDNQYYWQIPLVNETRTESSENRPRSPSFYDVLEVSPRAHPNVIKKAYQELVKLYHPDRASPHQRREFEERLKSINLAYEVLSDPSKRTAYDQKSSC